MTSIEDMKNKPNLTRVDIAELLKSIGKPGEKRDEKIAALKSLGRKNRQGHGIELTVESYQEY